MSNVLMFSVALGGYHWQFADAIATHRRYAARHGYEYVLVSRPRRVGRNDSAWLKVPLMSLALQNGCDWAAFVDADAAFQPKAPPLTTLAEPGKHLYMARGASGRVNSGVMLARNCKHTKEFFCDVLEAASHTPPPDCDLGWSENGHIIWLAHDLDCLKLLDQRWNNTQAPKLDDYIRHYTGALRCHYRRSLRGELLRQLALRLYPPVAETNPNQDPRLRQRILRLVRQVQRFYPAFAGPLQVPATLGATS
jgi:hypothetical protein